MLLLAAGPCAICETPFIFDPDLVPALPDPLPDGDAMPICEDCVSTLNAERRQAGLPEWLIPHGAYVHGGEWPPA
jgi:hypothetical protein